MTDLDLVKLGNETDLCFTPLSCFFRYLWMLTKADSCLDGPFKITVQQTSLKLCQRWQQNRIIKKSVIDKVILKSNSKVTDTVFLSISI